ncbi:MAG: hypothetical protein AUG51_04935 [Acidobacteria bacterium 13_1_20CM_3_53_8]|nr:MAG: hypothetical protein AUG51_04935 [Acidobacteria bacterium 13_1_20CM_3_53_8]
MSYTLNVQSQFYTPLNYFRENESSSIHRGMKPSFKKLGWFRLIVPGIGELTLLDIADKKITNLPFMKATWGIFICYQGQECEFRYEGEGEINVNVTDLGQIELDGNGKFLLMDLPSFILKKK